MTRQTWIMLWAVGGVAATFVEAILRLGARAHSELTGDVTTAQWVALAALTVMMTYVEGYRALQRRFAPSVIERASEAAHGRRLWAILAPVYAVSLIGAPARVIARSSLGVAMIVICVLVVRALPAPWRGIIDAAVCAALAWGLCALVWSYAAAHSSSARQPLPQETT